jgi:hypothetical protein
VTPACRSQPSLRAWAGGLGLALDGVFAPGADGTLRFRRLSPPTDPDVARLSAMTVPADGEIRCVWRVTGGQMHQDCSFVATGCPSSMTFSQEVPGVGSVEMTCDLDCHGQTPDSNGNCDCDVVLNTCQSTR